MTFEPTWESLQGYRCPDWFRDAKFGIWAHWGPQGVPMVGDWYARNMYLQGRPQYNHHCRVYGHPSKFGYKDIVQLWKAEQFDPEALMEVYRKAGAKYFYCGAVHHDNFDCWNSRHHRWNSVKVGPGKDIVGLFAAAARNAGLPFGVTEHLERAWSWLAPSRGADRTGPYAGVPYDGNDPAYEDLYLPPRQETSCSYPQHAPESWMRHWQARMFDLIDQYQPDLFYTDGAVPFGTIGLEVMAHFYNRSIERTGSLQAVYALKDHRHHANNYHGEYREGIGVLDVERGVTAGIQGNPWQTDTCVGQWYYRTDADYKTPLDIITMLVDIVSKNGNLLLNFPVHPSGILDEEELWIAGEIGKWLEVYGEAIYGTRPFHQFGEGPTELQSGGFGEKARKAFTPEDFRFTMRSTREGADLYAFIMKAPEDGRLTIKTLAYTNHEIQRIERVELLGSDVPVTWERDGGGLHLNIPALPSEPYLRVVKVRCS